MAGNLRSGDEQATRNGIQALESAFNGVLRSRQDVEAMRHNLSSGFKGGDGGAFQGLVAEWEGHANSILRGMRDMINSLNDTLKAMNENQGSSNEAINQAYKESNDLFNTLTGKS
ncbi:hypothetical protein ACIPSE_39555 [Streptomyces sp. NPDC090106]|uniref:hypothetical protein n=1 Tax=Streptomyces sp. NPDC090106 TaxID=3365946 RepID=UPI003804BE90